MTKIIAEVCQNHNGSRENLGAMIKAAAENGADIIKMQSIWSADVTKRDRFEEGVVDAEGKQVTIKRPHQPEVDRLCKLDLTLDDHQFFIDECKKYGVLPMTTIFAKHRIAEVAKLPWPERWVKVASYDCSALPFIEELAKHFDNFIISTGASYDEEIEAAAALMKKLGKRFAFLHCVTSYPNALDICNLARMEWLKQFTDEVGWSDHTKIEENDIIAAKAAIYLGALYVERHFTILPASESKDGPVSMTPALLKGLSDFRSLSKDEQKEHLDTKHPGWEVAIGTPTRAMTDVELRNRDYYRGRFASPDGKGGWVYNWQ